MKKFLKSILNDGNETVYESGLSHHDACHLACAKQSPIQIGEHAVTGIAGVCIPMFGNAHSTPEYSGYYDECRVGLFQAITSLTACSLIRAAYWCGWLITKRHNPIAVLIQQWKAM